LSNNEVNAFINLSIDSAYKNELVNELKKIKGVDKVFFITGRYDFIIPIKCRNMSELKQIISELRKLDWVKETGTSIILEEIKIK